MKLKSGCWRNCYQTIFGSSCTNVTLIDLSHLGRTKNWLLLLQLGTKVLSINQELNRPTWKHRLPLGPRTMFNASLFNRRDNIFDTYQGVNSFASNGYLDCVSCYLTKPENIWSCLSGLGAPHFWKAIMTFIHLESNMKHLGTLVSVLRPHLLLIGSRFSFIVISMQ